MGTLGLRGIGAMDWEVRRILRRHADWVSSTELATELYGSSAPANMRAFYVLISRVRRRHPGLIDSRPKVGYRMRKKAGAA